MTTKHKITMFSTLCFVTLSSLYFFNIDDEVTPISEKTEKKITIEKKPIPKKEGEEKLSLNKKSQKKLLQLFKKGNQKSFW